MIYGNIYFIFILGLICFIVLQYILAAVFCVLTGIIYIVVDMLKLLIEEFVKWIKDKVKNRLDKTIKGDESNV